MILLVFAGMATRVCVHMTCEHTHTYIIKNKSVSKSSVQYPEAVVKMLKIFLNKMLITKKREKYNLRRKQLVYKKKNSSGQGCGSEVEQLLRRYQ